MEFVELKRGDAKASICKYGATVTSWSVKGEELIFVSPKAVMDGSKAIRGGVPICWPSFGPWSEGPQHGFARSSVWSVDEEARTESSVTMELGGTELWPGHKFRLRYSVSLAEDGSLELELNAANCSEDKSLSFTSALHTYFRVPHVEKVSIQGLKGLSYIDKTLEGAPTVKEEREDVTLAAFTDRVYRDAPDSLSVQGLGTSGGRLSFSKTNLPDCVVWNPWAERAGGMADLGAEHWAGFVCVEAGQCVTPVILGPGEQWSAGHRLGYCPQ